MFSRGAARSPAFEPFSKAPSRDLLSSDDVLAGVTAEQTRRSENAAWSELADGGHATPLFPDQARLPLQHDQHPSRNLALFDQLMTKLELEASGVGAQAISAFRAEILKGLELKQGKRR